MITAETWTSRTLRNLSTASELTWCFLWDLLVLQSTVSDVACLKPGRLESVSLRVKGKLVSRICILKSSSSVRYTEPSTIGTSSKSNHPIVCPLAIS